MRSKLVFPSGGMETKYVWDRHNIQNNGIYKWDKHNVINETKYYWDKYSLLEDKQYYWKQFNLDTKTIYKWTESTLADIDSTYSTNHRVFYVQDMEIKSKYLNLNKNFSTTPVAKASYALTGTYVYLYKADNTYTRYTITDVKNNLFTCNPLYYGFVGFSYDLSFSYPYFYFTPETKMYVDANNKNYLTFSNLYNTTRNTVNKPTSLTDSPTGSYYIELNMMWPTTVTNIYSYDRATNITNKYTLKTYSVIYESLNDGFWRKETDAVGYKYIVSKRTFNTDSNDDYPLGITGNMLYDYSTGFDYVKGDYIQIVNSTDENAYPNGTYKGNYWYEATVLGTYYWDKYKTTITKYFFDRYKYVATTAQKYNCDKYELSAPGITLKKPVLSQDENGDTYISDYIEITLGDLTDVYWPAGGRDSNDIAFWMTPDYIYNDNTTYDGTTIKPIETISYYTESLLDYNNIIGEYANVMYGKKMLDNTSIIGMGFSGTDYNRQYSYYLFTPETTWGRETGTGAIRFNNVRPILFDGTVSGPDFPISTSAGFGWEPGNTATAENGGCYIDYISTIKREWNEDFEDWRINKQKVEYDVEITDTNPIFQEFSPYFSFPGTDLVYKDYDNGYYYIFNSCYYNGEIGEYIDHGSSTTDLRNQYPEELTSSTDYSYVYVLVDQEYGKGYQKIGEVSSRDEYAYPQDGMIEGDNTVYYVYSHFEEDDVRYLKGDFIESVESTNANQYPQDKYQGQNWYVYTGSKLFRYKGTLVESLQEERKTTHPMDGIVDDYWYVYTGFENNGPYKSRWIDEVETNNKDTYPTDGISGNYWYVYKKSYEGYKLQITDAKIKGGIDYNLDINPEEDYIVGTVASAEIAFEYNNINRDIQQYINANECIYYTWQPADNDWRQIGIFYLEDVTEVRDTIKVKAYDSIIKTEAYIDELIESINDWPLNINQMFNKTCEYLGLNGIVSEEINNSNNFITDNFEAINITGRQLLQYIAEAAGGLIMANADGALYLTKYRSKNIPLDKSKYVRYVKHNYSTQPIEGVNVRVTSDDMGITAGADSGNVYIIENNPLFFNTTDSGTKRAVDNLYNKLKDVSYVPAEVELLQDFGINCGDIITVDEDTFYVMSKNLSPSGCKLKCVGNKHRQLKESGLNSDIIALRGKTNELYRDLEQTRSTLTDIGADLRTEISQTAEEIKLYASNLNNSLNSSVSIKLDSITSEVNNLDKELSSRIEQTESSISSTVTEQGRVITQIQQDLDGIDLVYNSENGTASITIGDITVTDLVNGEYVTRTVAGIDLTGYVTFHSLETAGATTINGSNITTGTISAERINMRGAISWSDLSSDVQDAIDAGVSGDVDIPDYIKSTYIDGARIESPTINGGTLNSVAAYGDATHTTTIEDSQISFNIREYSSSGSGSFGYTAGVIDAYVNDTGMPDSARTGLRIESYSDGSSFSGGLSLIANRGLVLQSKDQDIFFYLPNRNPVALSTILDKLGL